MKILVFSDSHGSFLTMERAYLRNRDADYVLFLGDGIGDAEWLQREYPAIPLVAVRGNCDFMAGDYPTERVLPVGGIRIFMCHGHTYGVKSGYGALIRAAEDAGATIALCGHTHNADTVYIEDTETLRYVFNPGSAGRDTLNGGCFGVITVQNGNILCSNARIDLQIR